MSVIINTNFNVNAPVEIDGRLLVDRVDGTTSSLVSLTTGYNYRNMYVWVREEKAFYYLINSTTQGGATSSDWTKLSTGVGGSASAIDLTEVAFGTGTGITSSKFFTFETSNPTLIFGSASTICSSSRLSAIIGGCNNTIGTASCNSGIFGGCNNNLGTSSQSVIIGGQSNKLFGTTTNSINHSSIIGGQCNTLSATSSQSSIVGGYKNTLSCCSCNSSIVGGKSNCLCISSYNSSIIGGASNKLCLQSCYSSIVGGQSNTLAYFSKYSSIVGGKSNTLCASSCHSSIVGGCINTLSCYSKYSSIVGGKSNTLARYTSQSSIVGGSASILCCNSSQSSIVGGQCNTLTCHSCRSSIVGGYKNTLSFTSSHSSIVGGCGNTLSATSSFSSIIGGQSNTLCNYSCNSTIVGSTGSCINNSCNSAIIGGIGLTLSNECSIVYVPKLKIETASNVDASRILVWDTDNVVKYRDVSTIGGGGGSISLKSNAGLTNSGVTYATIYNTTVTATTLVPTNVPNSPGSSTLTANPLKWLVGLTAGYFGQKDLVQVLDMILFPTVPATYTQSSLVLNPPASATCKVTASPVNTNMTLTYTKNSAGTASGYTFLVDSSTVKVTTSNAAAESFSHGYTPSVPKSYVFGGTVSHLEGPIFKDSAGNDSLPNIPAGSCTAATKTITYIFPYYYGKVPVACTSLIGADVTNNTYYDAEVCALPTSGISVNFNAGTNKKGYLAIPEGISGNALAPSVTYTEWVDQNNQVEPIPDPINPTYLFDAPTPVYPVIVNGVSHTYSVYLFRYATITAGTWKFNT